MIARVWKPVGGVKHSTPDPSQAPQLGNVLRLIDRVKIEVENLHQRRQYRHAVSEKHARLELVRGRVKQGEKGFFWGAGPAECSAGNHRMVGYCRGRGKFEPRRWRGRRS